MEKLTDTIDVVSRVEEATHKLEDPWLAGRVRGWMAKETAIAGGRVDELGYQTVVGFNHWWLCTVTADRKLIESADDPTWKPEDDRRDYAHKVCRYVNKHAGMGGVWFAGWIDDKATGGQKFYLLWKDPDGDIQIPCDCQHSWEYIRTKYQLGHWANQCAMMIGQWAEFRRDLEIREQDTIKHAQGQPASPVTPNDIAIAQGEAEVL